MFFIGIENYKSKNGVIFDCFCFFKSAEWHSDLNFSLSSSNILLIPYSFAVPLYGPEMMEIVLWKLNVN